MSSLKHLRANLVGIMLHLRLLPSLVIQLQLQKRFPCFIAHPEENDAGSTPVQYRESGLRKGMAKLSHIFTLRFISTEIYLDPYIQICSPGRCRHATRAFHSSSKSRATIFPVVLEKGHSELLLITIPTPVRIRIEVFILSRIIHLCSL